MPLLFVFAIVIAWASLLGIQGAVDAVDKHEVPDFVLFAWSVIAVIGLLVVAALVSLATTNGYDKLVYKRLMADIVPAASNEDAQSPGSDDVSPPLQLRRDEPADKHRA